MDKVNYRILLAVRKANQPVLALDVLNSFHLSEDWKPTELSARIGYLLDTELLQTRIREDPPANTRVSITAKGIEQMEEYQRQQTELEQLHAKIKQAGDEILRLESEYKQAAAEQSRLERKRFFITSAITSVAAITGIVNMLIDLFASLQ